MSRVFTYSPSQVRALSATLSPERINTYLARCAGNEVEAILWYERNTELSEALYGVLQGFEVSLRNSIHQAMCARHRRDDWYDYVTLRDVERGRVADARLMIQQSGRAVTSGRMVAELTFGFWVALTAKEYAPVLWIPYLHRAFPQKSLGHGVVHKRLNNIRKLRNRVAHHECILDRDLENEYIEIVEAIGWICPHTALWVRETTRFERTFQAIYGRKIIIV
jgi:hypothetical protein